MWHRSMYPVEHWYRDGFGCVRRICGQWYGANDTRGQAVGTVDAVPPRVGPCDTRAEACRLMELALRRVA